MADLVRFLKDVASHQLTIIRNDGIHRHLRFMRPGSSCYWFDLVTWPGGLCIHGDCGTYVFARIEDMFQFFRSPSGEINQSYWAEKCTAACTTDGIQQFDPAKFTRRVVERFREEWRYRDRSTRREAFAALRNDVLGEENEQLAFGLLSDFTFDGWRLEDYWEIRAKKWTFRFLWCLRAIVWGIQQYDEATSPAVVEEVAHG